MTIGSPEIPPLSPQARRHDVVAALVGVIVFLVSASIGATREVSGFEEQAFRAINDLPDVPSWLYAPGILALGTIVGVVVVAFLAGIASRNWRFAAQVLVVATAAFVIQTVAKLVIGRGRPAEYLSDVDLRIESPATEGLPSGHTTVVFAMAVVVAYWVPSRWKWAPYVVAAVVALGRVYVGVHLPLDVVGGLGLGIACGFATVLVSQRVWPGRSGGGSN